VTFEQSIALVSQFFRVVYINGPDLQTTFRLQAIKEPVESVLPRTLTPQGNLRTALVEPRRGSFTDGSGVIASGGVSQQIFTTNLVRDYLYFQNVSDTVMRVEYGAVATSSSQIVLPNGGEIRSDFFVTTQSLNVFCITTGKAFVAREA
jgi:hypothetical protein